MTTSQKSKRQPNRLKFLLILMMSVFFSTVSFAQSNVTVSGKVTDPGTKMPIPGVSVAVKGKSATGVVTDEKGNYAISVPVGTVLVFSYLGDSPEEFKVSKAGIKNVVLSSTAKSMDEVVVVGYGQKSKKLLTESIGTVSSKEIQKLPVASADAAIQGRVSGVQITNVSGTPGSPVAIRIRGVGTVGNSQPLFIIDGVQVGNNGGENTNPLSSINPTDIENISVLKDASSAGIYGIRAANGVVLITTKRGKSGAPKVTLDAYYGIQKFPKKLGLNNTQQYVALAQEAIDNYNTQKGYVPSNPDYLTINPDLKAGSPVLGINTDWQTPTINKNAPINNYNVSVSGGTDKSNYFFSTGYFNQESVTKNWTLQRYTTRINSDYKIGSRLKIGQTLTISYQKVKRGINGGGDGFLYANNSSMPPFFKIYDDNNLVPGNRYGYYGNLGVAGLTIANQLGINEIVDRRDNNYRVLGGIYAELEIIKGLKYKSAASIDFNYSKTNEWQPGFTGQELGLDRQQNGYGDSRGEGYTQIFTNTLSYDKSIASHSFNILAGIEYQKLRGNNLGYTGIDFQSTDPAFYQVVRNGRGDPQNVNGGPFRVFNNASSGASNDAFSGYFGRLSYNFKDKYLVTATLRRDGASRFSKENRYGTFPSVSAAWRISEEPFFPENSFVSDLKLRGSWGEIGNPNTLSYAYISQVTFTPDYGIGGVASQAPSPANLPNKDLKWETVESKDFGFDASFFNNKVNLLATYYNRTTKDFLNFLPVAFTSGFGSVPVNVGNVTNSGIEVELSYNTNINKNLSFNISGNITTIKNRLAALAPGVEEFNSGGGYRTGVGYPIGYFYGYKALGIYQTPAQAAAGLPDNFAGSAPNAGDIIFQDNNGPSSTPGKQFSGEPDGKITPDDRTYLGKTIPDFFYGLSLSSNYKAFDISILFQGVGGIQVYNEFRANHEGLGGAGRNQLAVSQTRWKGEGTSNDFPRVISNDPYQNGRFNSRYVENAGFLRLKNMQVGYSIRSSVFSGNNVFKSARVYLAGTNLFRITKYTGLDPEVITYGSNTNQLGAGTDQGVVPQPITLQAGLQIVF